MNKIFLTSNTYFGRFSILETRNKYSSIDDMNDDMISIWNSTVTNSDIVYHIGNFAHDSLTAASVLDKLNGKIFFMRNNYDSVLDPIVPLFRHANIIPAQIVEITDYNTIISYYPLHKWGNADIHLYGLNYKHDLSLRPNSFSVSFDFWKKPVFIEDLINFSKEYNDAYSKFDSQYELLISLPGIEKGAIYYQKNESKYVTPNIKGEFSMLDKNILIKNPDWFKNIK